MSDNEFRKTQLEDCGLLTKGSKRVGPEPASDMTYCGLNDRPKHEREPEPAGRPAGPGEDFVKNFDAQARAYRAFSNPLEGESSPSTLTQGERIKELTTMILERIAAIRKDIQERQDRQKGPLGTDVPPLRGQDLGEFFHDREERETNAGGPEGDTPNITAPKDRTKIFAIGTRVRTVDRFKVRGIGVVVASANGVTTVRWSPGDEETYTSWELCPVEPTKPSKAVEIETKVLSKDFADDGDMSKCGL